MKIYDNRYSFPGKKKNKKKMANSTPHKCKKFKFYVSKFLFLCVSVAKICDWKINLAR